MTGGPSGGVDCHVHVIDPVRHPLPQGPGYKPRPDETGTADDLARVLARHGMAGALVVQLSGYGSDNSPVLDVLARDPARYRGIAVVEPAASSRELEALAARGVVGIRFNLPSYDPQALRRPGVEGLLARIAELGWFCQVHATDAQWSEAAPLLRAARASVLVDHLGLESARQGLDRPGFREVLRLGREGRAVVKLSSLFRITGDAHGFTELDSYVEALIAAFGLDRCVWGSDWPFPAVARRPEYADVLAPLARWLPDENDRARILRHNPARLFGFAPC